MLRFSRVLVPLSFLWFPCFPCFPATALEAAGKNDRRPFVHLQTDRPSYRLGETVWYRVHSTSREPVTVRLLDAHGKKVGVKKFPGAGTNRPRAGTFFMARKLDGGAFRLEATLNDAEESPPDHTLPLDVYDLDLPPLDLELTVLGDIHYAGATLTASFRARDLKGRPLRGAPRQNRAPSARTTPEAPTSPDRVQGCTIGKAHAQWMKGGLAASARSHSRPRLGQTCRTR